MSKSLSTKIIAGHHKSTSNECCNNCTQLNTITISKSNENRIYHYNKIFRCDLYGFSTGLYMVCEEYIESITKG